MKVKKIYIVTDAPIPVGMAPTNRILSYANGFRANGVESEIIIFRKTENIKSISNQISNGTLNGIAYKYLFKSPVKSKYFIKRRIDVIFGGIKLLWVSLFKFDSHPVIIYYSSHTYAILLLKFSKIFKSHTLLKEESEHPTVYNKIQNDISKYLFNKLHYHLFDGFLIMTTSLYKYFQQKYPSKPILHVPMTVDLSRFFKTLRQEKKELTYVGSLNNEKDGVNVLIESFAIIYKKFPDYHLALYGDSNNSNYYVDLANKLGIPKNNIVFFGHIANKFIPEILSNSSLLLLARPNSIQAQNGFPTKLGEYLATAKPTVVTSVGEIPNYLKDGESSYIAKPGDINSFASKMEEALYDYERAIQIGLNGRKVAENNFNNIKQTKNILTFINQLN